MEKYEQRLINLIKSAQEEYSDKYFIIAIPVFLGKKFVAYCSMKEDIELIIKYIDLLNEEVDDVIKSSLTYALISLYGKCFTDASKQKFPKLESKNLFEDKPELLLQHEFLMDLRHHFIAHRGETESEIGISYLIIPKEGDMNETQVRFSQLKQISFSKQQLNLLKELMLYIHNYLIEKIQKNGQKLHDDCFKIFDINTLKSMMINSVK
ncbi:hypothetical protein [Flavobacterium coralii]|uniref:hypothetical protein n=1 Tax=Flavobacterium coralii TaxID=2838017 RepID=UPI000C3B85EA|nr:hypothetical protein [Flavobacterium sp.]|tara:strand:+ start:348 stop:974 length:627 start_codon:yes stop_codon:yes gene_type:complete